jgi:hypothetical protein
VTLVMVERRFEEPADMDALQKREDEHSWCLEEHDVRFVRSYFSRDRRTMFCVYEAPDAEAVRIAQRTAEMPFERVVSASCVDWTEPNPYT